MLFRKFLSLILVVSSVVGILGIPNTDRPAPALAQDQIDLVLSIPFLWEDLVTPEFLAEFESTHPGVTVHVVYSDNGFFNFQMVSDSIETSLQNTEDFVSTADVLFVDSADITPESTLAGYYLDLSPLVNSDSEFNTDDYFPTIWQSFQWDQGIWALPVSSDVILVTYDPVVFDEVGLAYPNERWTVDDFANAARLLTQYNADGTVALPGLSTSAGGDNTNMLLRALLGSALVDQTVSPNVPSFANANLEYVLEVWTELEQEGVVGFGIGPNQEEVPLRVEGFNGYSGRFNDEGNEQQASLLPGGVAGLNPQGFAVSGGTLYPELAYELAKFLSNRSEFGNNAFSAVPARQSWADTQQDTAPSPVGGGEGDGPRFTGVGRFGEIPEQIQTVIDQGIIVGLPISELRYMTYLTTAMTDMRDYGTDALSAIQTIEAQALGDMQTALDYEISVVIVPPELVYVEPGQIALKVGLNTGGFIMIGPNGQQLPNQQLWDQINADFVASDPDVGQVILEMAEGNSLDTLAEQYDCFILSSNQVAGNDVSSLLNLDPLMDTDYTFDRNDLVGNILSQLQQDNKTWALPIAISPQMLSYDREIFAQAGVPEPIGGWTVEQFVDALQMLYAYSDETAPFVPMDPSGSYLMMLIAAFGGLPIDYRTSPPTLNFTDPTTVDAIRQVLDLITSGYIEYTDTSGQQVITIGGDTQYPITTDFLNIFNFGPPGAGSPDGATTEDTTSSISYPQGSQFGVISYEITTGYISANAQNPEACYRWLSTVAQNPQLFDGMPARRSLLNSPEIIATQGEALVEVYNQFDTLMQNPNTIVFPTFGRGRGSVSNLLTQYWLNQAFSNYIEGADLEVELEEAQRITTAYQECVALIPSPESDVQSQDFGFFQQVQDCATSADPNFSLGN